MSELRFYDMMRNRWPELNETEVALKLGIKTATFRSHRTSIPTTKTIIAIAEHLGEDSLEFLSEVVKASGGVSQIVSTSDTVPEKEGQS